jgi:hypothetical protein
MKPMKPTLRIWTWSKAYRYLLVSPMLGFILSFVAVFWIFVHTYMHFGFRSHMQVVYATMVIFYFCAFAAPLVQLVRGRQKLPESQLRRDQYIETTTVFGFAVYFLIMSLLKGPIVFALLCILSGIR